MINNLFIYFLEGVLFCLLLIVDPNGGHFCPVFPYVCYIITLLGVPF